MEVGVAVESATTSVPAAVEATSVAVDSTEAVESTEAMEAVLPTILGVTVEVAMTVVTLPERVAVLTTVVT